MNLTALELTTLPVSVGQQFTGGNFTGIYFGDLVSTESIFLTHPAPPHTHTLHHITTNCLLFVAYCEVHLSQRVYSFVLDKCNWGNNKLFYRVKHQRGMRHLLLRWFIHYISSKWREKFKRPTVLLSEFLL